MRTIRFVSFSLIFFGLLVCCVFPAFAFKIDRPTIHVSLDPGQGYSGAVTFTNDSSQPLTVNVYLEDFVYLPPYDSNKQFSVPGTSSYSLMDYFSFYPQTFVVEPFASKPVNFSVKTPKDFDKVHCGALFFEASIGNAIVQNGKNVQVMMRMGSLIFVTPKKTEKKGVFGNISSGKRVIKGDFTNTGKTFIYALGSFYVMSSDGNLIDRSKTGELYLLPMDKASVEIPISDKLSSGDYTMVLSFDLHDNDVLVKEVDFHLDEAGGVKITATRD